MDVCPFVPVRGVEVEECIYCASRFAEKLAAELEVPVFLYGEAAKRGPHRRTVPQIRAGEYEGLPEKVCMCIHNNIFKADGGVLKNNGLCGEGYPYSDFQ
jgi:glutamate formiminotransferase